MHVENPRRKRNTRTIQKYPEIMMICVFQIQQNRWDEWSHMSTSIKKADTAAPQKITICGQQTHGLSSKRSNLEQWRQHTGCSCMMQEEI
jgi:hypothetical protein